jgi:hypothetical protein
VVFWLVMSCSLVGFSIHLQLDDEDDLSSKIMVTMYQSTQCHNAEELEYLKCVFTTGIHESDRSISNGCTSDLQHLAISCLLTKFWLLNFGT